MSATSDFVYVNQNGTVRELSSDEREDLSKTFKLGDGSRPYLKAGYNSRDGWGSLSGFLPRQKLPPNLVVLPVNPDYQKTPAITPAQLVADHTAAGHIVV